MATDGSTLIARTRRLLRDWPDLDSITQSIDNTSQTLFVPDSSVYATNSYIEVDQEIMLVAGQPTASNLDVRRAKKGSVAAPHGNAASVLVSPRFYSVEIFDALNEGLDAVYPKIYRPVNYEYTGITNDYEYLVPNLAGIEVPIPYLSKVELMEPGALTFYEVQNWSIERGEAPFIKFGRQPINGSTIRIQGYGPWSHLVDTGDTLSVSFPKNAEDLLPLWAASTLLASAEAERVRIDSGVIDSREQANRVGSSMAASDSLLRRFYQRLSDAAMNPIPPHCKPTFR